jgi:membrane-bound serine protease (ClpP class)
LVLAVSACSASEGGGIDVIDVSGPLDSSALSFMVESIESAAATGQEMAVLQINSRAVLDEDLYDRLDDLVMNPPLPVAVWLGPEPASAFGGMSYLVRASPITAGAPGTLIGKESPTIAGDPPSASADGESVLFETTDLPLQPSIRQYLQDLDGTPMPTQNGTVVVETLRPFENGGVEGVTLKTVTFRKPPLTTRFFRLAATPEAAFFFLVVGLSMVTFEFYALGPGVAAGVAALSLWLASWGIVNLPVRPWALALAIAGWILLTTAQQRGGVLALTILGAVGLQVAGLFYIEGSGQIDPRWWLVLLSVLAALFFFLLAMPTVQRSRLSTQTIGRDSLIGRTGVAIGDFNPDGTVEVGGARWRATAHRESGIGDGSLVVVTGVDGLFLEIEAAADAAREN